MTPRIFFTLDWNSEYYQVPSDPVDENKTWFTCHLGLYRFIRMPFGLKNELAIFQRAVNIILSMCKWKYALVYLEDVIVYSKNRRKHFENLSTVLSLLKTAEVSMKLKKSNFFEQAVDYLVHVVRTEN